MRTTRRSTLPAPLLFLTSHNQATPPTSTVAPRSEGPPETYRPRGLFLAPCQRHDDVAATPPGREPRCGRCAHCKTPLTPPPPHLHARPSITIPGATTRHFAPLPNICTTSRQAAPPRRGSRPAYRVDGRRDGTPRGRVGCAGTGNPPAIAGRPLSHQEGGQPRGPFFHARTTHRRHALDDSRCTFSPTLLSRTSDRRRASPHQRVTASATARGRRPHLDVRRPEHGPPQRRPSYGFHGCAVLGRAPSPSDCFHASATRRTGPSRPRRLAARTHPTARSLASPESTTRAARSECTRTHPEGKHAPCLVIRRVSALPIA